MSKGDVSVPKSWAAESFLVSTAKSESEKRRSSVMDFCRFTTWTSYPGAASFSLGSVGCPLQETAVVCPEIIIFKHADCAFVSFECPQARTIVCHHPFSSQSVPIAAIAPVVVNNGLRSCNGNVSCVELYESFDTMDQGFRMIFRQLVLTTQLARLDASTQKRAAQACSSDWEVQTEGEIFATLSDTWAFSNVLQ